MSFFSVIIYFFVLFFFGWQLVRYLLNENRIEHLLGLGGISGVGLYIVLINALGYLMPIKIAFYSVLALFLALGSVLLYLNRQKSLEWGIGKKWRKTLLGTALFLLVASGIISFRFPFTPNIGGIPIAATIVEGNFPVAEIWSPGQSFYYHYAPELFAAATNKVTGLPLYLAYNFQFAVLMGILFLLGFILVKQFGGDNFKSFLASLLMLYSGTLFFLNGIKGIPILYNLLILHKNIEAPFKFVSDSFSSLFSFPPVRIMTGIPWLALAFPLMISVIYLYFYLTGGEARKAAFLLPGILLAFLALNAETYFAVLCSVLLVYPFALLLFKRDKEKFKKFLVISCLILLIALPVAFIQGGILKGVLVKFISGGDYYASFFTSKVDSVFGLSKTPFSFYYFQNGENNDEMPFYNLKFLSEWALLFLLLIPGFFHLFKKYFQFGLFLAASTIAFFIVPFLITLNSPYMDSQMIRLFYPVNLFGGLAAGLFLGNLHQFLKRAWLKRLTLFAVVILMAQGLIFQSLYLSVAWPPGTWNAARVAYAESDTVEGESYAWVKKNTTIKDYFLIVMKDSEYGPSNPPNYRFILNTGRMAPIYSYYNWFDYKTNSSIFPDLPSYPEFNLFKEVRDSCSSSAVRSLKYTYLYVNEKWADGLEKKCLSNNNLELKLEIKEGDKLVRIYKVL